MQVGNFGAPFRLAGLSYLQYLGISSRAVRSCLKEPHRSKAAANAAVFYNKSEGVGAKVPTLSHLPKSKVF